MHITLRANEKIYVNGAVLRADRKVSLELMNDAVFLLENHIMQEKDATTPLRQWYFIVQMMLMEGARAPGQPRHVRPARRRHGSHLRATSRCSKAWRGSPALVERRRYFEALKTIRSILPLEDAIMNPAPALWPRPPDLLSSGAIRKAGTMQVNSATSSPRRLSASTASATAQAATVDYNSFLKLLVQEMKNQDPTSPTDPTQYLGQLASFSNVEQAIQTNSKLDTLLTTSSLTQAETVDRPDRDVGGRHAIGQGRVGRARQRRRRHGDARRTARPSRSTTPSRSAGRE